MPGQVGRPRKNIDLTDAAQTVVTDVETAIDSAEHVALKAGEALVDSRLPAAAPVLNVVEPEIEHVAYHVTNVVTTDFAHRAETYIIALEKSIAEKLHTTALLDRLATAIKNDLGGIPILASALHVTEVKKNVKGIVVK